MFMFFAARNFSVILRFQVEISFLMIIDLNLFFITAPRHREKFAFHATPVLHQYLSLVLLISHIAMQSLSDNN